MAVIWTPDKNAEFAALRAARAPVASMADKFGTTVAAIYAHARVIGARVMDRKTWDADEVKQLISLDESDVAIRAIAHKLARTEASVAWKLKTLGRNARRMRYWAADEARLVDLDDAGKAPGDIARALNRPVATVRDRLARLGRAERRIRWSEADKARLVEAVGAGKGAAEIATLLDRKIGSVTAMAYALGLRFARPARALSADEVEKLRVALRARGGLKAFAAASGLDVRFLRKQARANGLFVRTRRTAPLDEAAKAAIVGAARAGGSITEAAKAMGRDVRTLKAVAAAAGVAFTRKARVVEDREREQRQAARAARDEARRREREALRLVRLAQREEARKAREAENRLRAEKARHDRLRAEAARRPAPRQVVVAAPVVRPRRSAFNTPLRGRAQAALPTRAEIDAAVAAFLAKGAITREALDPVEGAIRAIRRRGFSVVRDGAAFVVDGRARLDGASALAAFAAARAIEVPQGLAMAS